MRKFLAITGAIALVIVALLGGTLGYLAYKGHGLDRDSAIFVDNVIQNIVAKSERDQLLALCSPNLIQKTSTSQMNTFFNVISGLGPLTTYEGAKGQAYIRTWNGKTTITAAYVATAKFRNGTARFTIDLDRPAERWRITNLHIDLGQGTHLDRGA